MRNVGFIGIPGLRNGRRAINFIGGKILGTALFLETATKINFFLQIDLHNTGLMFPVIHSILVLLSNKLNF